MRYACSVMKVGNRVTCPVTGKTGKLVFISPVNGRYYVEFDRKIPFVTYPPGMLLQRGGDLFGPL